MKEIYMQIMQANDGIPEDMTLADMLKMRDLNIYHWQEYEREKERQRTRLQLDKQADLGKTTETPEGESVRKEENN